MTNPLVLTLSRRDELTSEERQALEGAISHTKAFQKGEDMLREGDRPKESTVLLTGFAARYKTLRSGTRQITSLHVMGDFVDLHSALLKTMDHAVVALTPCVAASVPHERVRQITEAHPHLGRLLSVTVAIDGAIHRQWLAMSGRASAQARLAHLLCELFLRLQVVGQTNGRSFALPLTQTELGDVLGISAVHVNRTLQELRRDRLVSWQGSGNLVEIEDWERLQDLAEFDPTYLNLQKEPR